MAKAMQGTNTQSYGQSNNTLTKTQCLQKEPKYELGISQPSCKELQHFTTHTMELKNENKRALVAVEKPDSANPNPQQRMRKLGLRGKLLKHPLHGGGCSKCPPKYSVHSGSNGIVYTALSGNQIIAHNLINDFNDNVIYKVKNISFQ